ncbi:MAG TPA: N-acetylmuramoyl-L-alanine amidase family protein [Anaerovoracaceae bacterium]|nr:N-acetylmuramoyl-L-alanine amidase family protein [Anaerovoracaceae bacterium]
MNRLIRMAFLTMIAVILGAAVCFADPGGIGIKLDGADIITDTPPVIENGRTLAPIRVVFEAMGGTASWNEASREVTLSGRDTEIKLTIGSTDAYINGTVKTLDVPARIINSRTMIPVRFVSEALGCEVSWDEVSRTVSIVSPIDEKDLAVIRSIQLSSKGDKVTIKADREVPDVKTYKMTDPSRLVFEIKGAKLNIQDGMLEKESPFIKSIDYSQYSRDTVRITAELTGSASGTVSRSDSERTFFLNFEEDDGSTEDNVTAPESEQGSLTEEDLAILDQYGLPAVAEEARNKLVVIDPGHGGKDTGALGYEYGSIVLYEKDVNLDIGLRVQKLLEAAGVRLYMIRTEDVYVPLYDRQDIANNLGASLYVSIHNNANSSSVPNGTEVYYRGPNDPPLNGISAVTLAENLQKTISANLGVTDRGTKISTGLAVLRRTLMPAVIIEGAYISNQDDLNKMKTDSYREQYAVSLVKCVIEALNNSI